MKTEILRMLRETDAYVSGQQLCDHFGVSRTAVWKVINKLKEEGYEIEAISNKGYCLKRVPDLVTKEACLSAHTKWAGRKIVYGQEMDSTNTKAKQLAEEVDSHGLLVVTDKQNAGKGRRGRSWESLPGSSIFMTLVVKPNIVPANASMLTLVAALSVSEGIDMVTKLRTRIKWPNDILVGTKKVCGILTEMSADMDQVNYVAIGMGINTGVTTFPEEIAYKATSLALECGKEILRAELIAAIMECFERNYEIFLNTEDLSQLMDKYGARLVNQGQKVKVLEPNREYMGVSEGINERGELLVRDENNRLKVVMSGEVSVRGIYGYV
ncbi:MAG: biotin--[acetyl-CoA-carboxylase] ligase [Lachnospiraceae bacterium]